uniref:Uncharacterized protein n=1 Tax=Romanomermis culicivorax TaxID=13658 RepID=A0A915IXC4_ROMCU
MTTLSTSSTFTADEPPPYRESTNINECYVPWAKQQPHQKDLSFTCDADSTASSYPPYVQLVFPNSTMFVFETFAATLEDWTARFSLVDG